MKLELPLSYEDIPLKHIVKHGNSDLSDYDLVKIYGGYTYKDLKDVPYKLIEAGAKHVKDVLGSEVTKHFPIIEIEGKDYGFIPDWAELTTGEYIDLTKALEDPIVNATGIMSILYRPITRKIGDTYEIEEYKGKKGHLFNEVSASLYLGASVFFYNIRKESLKTSLNSLEKALVQNSQKNTAGIKLSTFWRGKILPKLKALRSFLLRKS